MFNREKEIEQWYEIKCNKYTSEQLTDNLKALLMCEAVSEIDMMYGTLMNFKK